MSASIFNPFAQFGSSSEGGLGGLQGASPQPMWKFAAGNLDQQSNFKQLANFAAAGHVKLFLPQVLIIAIGV